MGGGGHLTSQASLQGFGIRRKGKLLQDRTADQWHLWGTPFLAEHAYPQNDAHALGIGGEGKDLQDGVVHQGPQGRLQLHAAQVSPHQRQAHALRPCHQCHLEQTMWLHTHSLLTTLSCVIQEVQGTTKCKWNTLHGTKQTDLIYPNRLPFHQLQWPSSVFLFSCW